MKITKKEEYLIIENTDNTLVDFAESITENYSEYSNDNVIVDLLDNTQFELKDALLFLEISNIHRADKKSFVIANAANSIDVIPDELIVVPTLGEAEDIIKMEELERELGF
tara:strand:- start:5857 stop:6189 length:333 start_codon:yes stop_codon:yes gene_type:complete